MVATRILLVDDSEQWRLLVRSMLQSNSWFRIVGEATDGVDAIEKAATLVPDVVLLDIGMPRLNGIEAAKEIKQACPESRIIFLTQEADSDIQNVALANGAFAYLLKSRASHELRTTIETAMLVSSYPC